MPKNVSISILLISLLFSGCSSNKPKKSIFSKEQTAELRAIIDKHMTDQDWAKLQQEHDRLEKLINHGLDIDIKNDYDKDFLTLMFVIQTLYDNPDSQKEMTSFMTKYMQGKIIELKSSKNKVLTEEETKEEIEKQFEHPYN